MNLKQKFEISQKNFNLMAKSKLSLQEFGPVSSFSTSILSGLMIGLTIQYFIGYEPFPVVIFVLVGIYDGYRRMWRISRKMEGEDIER